MSVEKVIITKSKIVTHNNAISTKLGVTANRTIDEMTTVVENMPNVKNPIEFDQMTDIVSKYLSGSKPTETYPTKDSYIIDDYLNALDPNYDPEDENASVPNNHRGDLPNGVTISIASNGTLLVNDAEAGKTSGNVNAGDKTIYNLTPGVKSYYINHLNGAISQIGFIKPKGQVRFIKTNTTYSTYFSANVRDLGGWTCDGGSIAYNKIFRGARFNGQGWPYASSEDQDTFVNLLGVRDEIDLRRGPSYAEEGQQEVSDNRLFSAFGDKVNYINIEVDDRSNKAYTLSNVKTSSAYAEAIKRIISDMKYERAVYVHCTAGADRTGCLCAIIEALCGVSEDDLDKDYELTSFVNSTNYVLKRKSAPSWATTFKSALRNNHTGNHAMRDGAVDWAISVGLTAKEINSLRKYLIDGTPEDVAHDITSKLSNVTISNPAKTVVAGSAFTATLSAPVGYTITASITMGGNDITSSVYSNGVISIGNVIGDINIDASAVADTPIEPTNILDTYGYDNDTRMNSSGTPTSATGYCLTGYIPISYEDVIRFTGGTIRDELNSSLLTYIFYYKYNSSTQSYEPAATGSAVQGNGVGILRTNSDGSSVVYGGGGFYTASKNGEVYEIILTPGEYQITSNNYGDLSGATHVRLGLYGYGENIFMTKNEMITSENS